MYISNFEELNDYVTKAFEQCSARKEEAALKGWIDLEILELTYMLTLMNIRSDVIRDLVPDPDQETKQALWCSDRRSELLKKEIAALQAINEAESKGGVRDIRLDPTARPPSEERGECDKYAGVFEAFRHVVNTFDTDDPRSNRNDYTNAVSALRRGMDDLDKDDPARGDYAELALRALLGARDADKRLKEEEQ